MDEPGASTGSNLEMQATPESQFQFRRLELFIETAGVEDLRTLCLLLGKQALVIQPAALKWAGMEAARALSLGMRSYAEPGEAPAVPPLESA